MVDREDPQQLRLATWEKQFCGGVGGTVLLAAAITTIAGAWMDWTLNSVAIGALYAVGLVLTVLSVAGRLPNSVSVSDKGFALGYVAGAKETAEQAAEKIKEVQTAIQEAPQQKQLQEAVANAQGLEEAKTTLADEVVPQLVKDMPTEAAAFLPDRAEQMQKIAESMTK